MQKKTITKTIQAYLEEWLESINDKELRKEVKENVIVSGGAIASMFLGEKVNDYDIYIQDRNVLIKLANYYAKPYSEIQILDGEEKYDDEGYNNQWSIALRNLTKDRVRIFVENDRGVFKVDQVKASKGLKEGEELPKFRPLFFSPNAITLTDKIQIVIRFHGTPEEIHKNYDFIHATNYFTFKDGVVTNLHAMESLISRRLYYQGSLYPVASIFRIRKFMKRDWDCGAGEALKIMFQISKLDLTNVDVLEEQLIGVDVFYFEKLISAIRESMKKDPAYEITDTKLGKLIDDIFEEDHE